MCFTELLHIYVITTSCVHVHISMTNIFPHLSFYNNYSWFWRTRCSVILTTSPFFRDQSSTEVSNKRPAVLLKTSFWLLCQSDRTIIRHQSERVKNESRVNKPRHFRIQTFVEQYMRRLNTNMFNPYCPSLKKGFLDGQPWKWFSCGYFSI